MLPTQFLLSLYTEHDSFCAIFAHIARNGCRLRWWFIF